MCNAFASHFKWIVSCITGLCENLRIVKKKTIEQCIVLDISIPMQKHGKYQQIYKFLPIEIHIVPLHLDWFLPIQLGICQSKLMCDHQSSIVAQICAKHWIGKHQSKLIPIGKCQAISYSELHFLYTLLEAFGLHSNDMACLLNFHFC